MDKSDSQKKIDEEIITEDPAALTITISNNELTIIMKAGGYEAAYTADEARALADGILSQYHQRGRGSNIVPTADYIYDLADVLDNKVEIEEIEQKWDHNGEVGNGDEYTIVTDTGNKPILSFSSKIEAMNFCEAWNSRSPWTIEYHLENNGERVAIWNLTKLEGQSVAERLEANITELICSEDVPDWEIDVEHQAEAPAKNGSERIFAVNLRNPDDYNERYQYQIYYAHDGKGINTLTQQSVTHRRRVRIDRQRGRILEAMSKVPKQLGIYIGSPDAHLEWLNLGAVLSPDQEFP